MQCAELLRVQAYFDGEVDAISAADIERHTEHCTECRALLVDLQRSRAAIRQELEHGRAPPALHGRIMRALEREPLTPSLRADGPQRSMWRMPPFWVGALGGVGGSALAAVLGFLLISPSLTNPLLDELVAAHVRSLIPSHLIDVVSTDKHTVKPWFAGRTDVSPVVADFAPEGYRLLGGRADYLLRQRAAVVVYQHGPHMINVFSWANNGYAPARTTTRNGYHLAFWKAGNLEYCAVSDTGWNELQGLVSLLQNLSTAEAQPAG